LIPAAVTALFALLVGYHELSSVSAGGVTYVVDTSSDTNLTACTGAAADCSLRGAIGRANAASSPGETIAFDPGIFPSAGPVSINLGSALPAMTGGSDTIDGSGAGVIVETASEPAAFVCLNVNSDGNTVKGIHFSDCLSGIQVSVGASGNVIGPANTVYDNTTGILLAGDNNTVAGNKIGTSADGSIVHPSGGNANDGISVTGTDNVIGGTAVADRNVISGNGANGIDVESLATGNEILGNYIGISASGAADLGNTLDGVTIRANNTVIGGAVAGARNVISGNNSDGVEASAGAVTGIEVLGNFIGTDSAGTADLGNSLNGINVLAGAPALGGVTGADRNVISGNNAAGIRLASSGAVIQGNFIGTDVNGTADLGNSAEGINFATSGASGVTIGGTAQGAGNVISGNDSNGVTLFAGSGTIQGNFIGTDAAGDSDLGNAFIGITVNTSGNTIGGAVADAGNVISGNNSGGINISGVAATSNTVQSNYIGLQADGASPLGNGSHGVIIANSASTNTIGGAEGASNTIAFNSGDGISVTSSNSVNNGITFNSIHSNTDLGIDLTPNGVTENDAAPDGDSGANGLQNFPVLTQVSSIGGITNIQGTATGPANTALSINFYHSPSCDSSGNGEGEVPFATAALMTNGAGSVAINQSPAVVVPAGRFVTATATTAGGNTSEFSDCVEVPPLIVNDAAYPGDGTCTVANCTLNEAIVAANAAAGPDIIEFAIGSGPQVLPITGVGLAAATGPTTIDGTSQPGFAGAPIIELDGSGTPGGTIGLSLSGIDNVVKGLVITGFGGNGISLNPGSRSTIQGNYIGLKSGGLTDAGNAQDGVLINGSAQNVIGGSVSSQRNFISGNNGNGVRITGAGSTGNEINGNIIGLDVSGTVDVGNSLDGLAISNGASGNRIGIDQAGSGNVISGNNFDGIEIASGSSNNVIENNLIGTDISGTLDRGNSFEGVLINASPSNRIGGISAFSTNVISGNNSDGIEVSGAASTNNLIQGNLIGTDTNGSADLGNTMGGVNITNSPAGTTVGGDAAGMGNVISGNNSFGVGMSSVNTVAVVQGNLIGTNAAGDGAVGNGAFGGVRISGAGNNVIGGDTPAERNVISGNQGDGVRLDTGSFSNFIIGNYIGTRPDGVTALANTGTGVSILDGDGNEVGGAADTANVIAFNTLRGVQVSAGVANTIARNSIHSNGALGIDLAMLGLTANDPDDGDFGANRQQNYPVLTTASTGGLDTKVAGTLDSTASATFAIDVYSSASCDATTFGEGELHIGSFQESTNASGDVTLTRFLPVVIPVGRWITATATNVSTADTSEFSQCHQVVSDADSDDDLIPDNAESACGSDHHISTSTPERIDGAFAATDEDQDGQTNEPLPASAAPFDCDGDGYTGNLESGNPLCLNSTNDDNLDDAVVNDGCGAIPQSGSYSEAQFKIGTNDQDPCGGSGWPSDLATAGGSANKLNIQDVLAFVAPTRRIDTSPSHANFSSRFDLLPGKGALGTWLNVQDITAMFNAPAGFPPMFNSQRAFDKSCPWPQ
jgi:hypothetical protein